MALITAPTYPAPAFGAQASTAPAVGAQASAAPAPAARVSAAAAPSARASAAPVLTRLPLLTLYLTERCNSRCVTCDYWQHGRADVTVESVKRLLPSLARLRTQAVLLSGGEPLLHPQFAQIAQLIRANGSKVLLVTSGLSLAKHARRAAGLFDEITVSMDGTDRPTYAAIRGLDAFDKVCEGVRAAGAHGRMPNLRVTLQRANYAQLPDFVRLAKDIGARRISFLAVDVASSHAFGRAGALGSADASARTDAFGRAGAVGRADAPTGADAFAQSGGGKVPPALSADDLPVFERLIDALERDHAEDFRSGFIAESPAKLRAIARYFKALCGLDSYPPVQCNAPSFSAVITAQDSLQPCFFISGPPAAPVCGDLEGALNGTSMLTLRAAIRAGRAPECATCVCSMWRDPRAFDHLF